MGRKYSMAEVCARPGVWAHSLNEWIKDVGPGDAENRPAPRGIYGACVRSYGVRRWSATALQSARRGGSLP